MKEDNIRDILSGMAQCALGMLLGVFILAMFFCSCTRTVYEPAESKTVYHTDTLRITQAQIDTVTERDSVFVYVSGDTVRITKYRDRFRYKKLTDTVYSATADTVHIKEPYPVVKELSRWERAKMSVGGVAMGLGAIGLGFAIWWLIKKIRRCKR